MEQLDLNNFDVLLPNIHYKNMKTEVIDNKSQVHSIDNIDYSKLNCSTKDLLKEKDKKIEILQQQMLQLQKKLERQMPNNNYKNYNTNNNNSSNSINYTVNTNCNTSTNFPLKSEIKKIWEELAFVSLLDNFIDFEKQPEIIFHCVSEMVLITDKLISELCLDMYQKVSQSLNIINDKKFINDIEKTSRPLIKEHLNKTFAVTNNQQFFDKFIKLFSGAIKNIFSQDKENQEKIEEIVEGQDFKLMIKKIKDIMLFTKFNDQQLFFKIEKDFNKRIIERIKIKNFSEKKKYLIINDNNKEEVDAVIILKPPVLRAGFPLNNDFKTIIILYEKEGNSKSYKNLNNNKKTNNQIDNNINKRKINKILGMQIKKMLTNFKSPDNTTEIKTPEYNTNKSNKFENKENKNNEEIINIVFSKVQRNSYQKLSKNNNKNLKNTEDRNIFKTEFSKNEKDKENDFIKKETYEEKINNVCNKKNNKRYKNINIYKNNANYSNDNRLKENRNIISKEKHRPQLSDHILKNNSSKNLLDYMHKDLLIHSASKKYQKIKNETNNSFNQNNFITYNNNEMKSIISSNNNNTDNEEGIDNEIDKEEIIFHKKTANYKNNNFEFNEEEINDKNKIQRNSNNNGDKNILNQIPFNQDEKNTFFNNQRNSMNYNQLKEKLYSKINLNQTNNKNYKKINSQNQKSNTQHKNKKKNEYYYKANNIYEITDINNNDINKLRIADIDNNKFMQSKIENNMFNINENKLKINYNQNEQDLLMFKKNKTAKLISNRIKKNPKKDFKIIPLIKLKKEENQENKVNPNINQNQNQNRRSSNKIKFKNTPQNSKNNFSDIYRKIIKNTKKYKGINNREVNIKAKKTLTLENNNKSNNNYIGNFINMRNDGKEGEQKKKLLLSYNKYNNNQGNKYKNGNGNNLSQEKKYTIDMNYQYKRNNNLIEDNFYDYNDINNTGYKIRNVNINYFNIMQPNKLYINQNSTRSKSRPSEGERNKVLINYNNYNKNIIQNSNQNNNIKNISYKNNVNNNQLFFKRVNNNTINNNKNASQDSNQFVNNINPNNKINKANDYHYKSNLVKNVVNNNNFENCNIVKNPLNIITDLSNMEKMTEQIKNEKRVLIKTKIKKQKPNNTPKLKEEKYNIENNNDKKYVNNEDDKNSLIIDDINNQSSNTSRKNNAHYIMNNKHISYAKIPNKVKNNEIRPSSGGVRYIEKNDNTNKFNSEYINQISTIFNNKEYIEMRSSYTIMDKERNNNKNNNQIYNINQINNLNNNLNSINANNKNNYGFNGTVSYNYNSFRKNNKFN